MNININLQYLRGQWSKDITALRGAVENNKTIQFVESEIEALLEKLHLVHQQSIAQATPVTPVAPVVETPAAVVEAPAPVVIDTPVVEAPVAVADEVPAVEAPVVEEPAPVVETTAPAPGKKYNN